MPNIIRSEDHILRRLSDAERLRLSTEIPKNPWFWANYLFDVDLWSARNPATEWYNPQAAGQLQFVEAVFAHRKVAWHTGHSLGKTYAWATLTALWLLSHIGRPGEVPFSYAILSGANWDSVRRMLFAGLKDLHKACLFRHMLPEPTSISWELSDRWAAYGLSPSEENIEAFQGWHSRDGTMVGIDEASHVTHEGKKPIMSNLTGANDRVVFAGNPVRSEGAFVDAITTDDPGWFVLHSSSYDTPNARAGRDIYPGLATRQWIAEQEAGDWARGTPDHEARIMGRIPDQSEDTFIARSTVRNCGERTPCPWRDDTTRTLGVDVARSLVGDQTVFVVRGDRCLHHYEPQRGWSEGEIFSRVLELVAEYEIDPWRVFIDATGVGSGLTDRLIEHGFPATIRFMAGAGPNRPKDFANRRAEAWWTMRNGLEHLAIPKDMLRHFSDLAVIYKARHKTRDVLVIENKDDFKQRVGHSPDAADALALTYAVPVGEAAFPAARAEHALSLEPSLTPTPNRDGYHTLRLATMPPAWDRPGLLVRSTWLSRSDVSATLWVHIDDEGCWTVVDAASSEGLELRRYWAQVCAQSAGQHYHRDLLSGPADKQDRSNQSTWSLLAGLTDDIPDHAHAPWILAPNVIAGARGLAVLDRLLVSTLARYPEDRYWADKDPDAYADDEQIYIWPEEVLDQVLHARRKPAESWNTDPDAEATDDLIAGGGAYVKCLRLLAVSL